MILNMFEHLGVKLPMGIWDLVQSYDTGCVKVPGSPASSSCCGIGYRARAQVCSGHWLRSEGTHATMILGVLELLGVLHLLGIVELAAEIVPKICSGHWLRPTISSMRFILLAFMLRSLINLDLNFG